MTHKLRSYIERNADLLNSNEDLVLLYTNAFRKKGNDYRVLGELTRVLIDAGIDVLRYSNVIPPYYFDKSRITEFVLPEHIEEIQYAAFANCINLTTVNLNKQLRLIQQYAFYKTSLTHLDYNGTTDDFKTLVTLEHGWRTNSTIKEIHCLDGVISL